MSPTQTAFPRTAPWALTVLLLCLRPARAEEPVSVPRFTHPGAGQVFYFVLTDRFENGSTANDSGGIHGGPDVSGFDPTRISHYHGGDFVGLTSKLDYIKGLGATAIWITPPFRNKPMQMGTAGYHGYWILDFTSIDPHLGTEAEFGEFVAQAHRRGMRVYLDIVANHTADVITYKDGRTNYIDIATAPYRTAAGVPFDAHEVAYNGVGSGTSFPQLSAERSFAHVPVLAPEDIHAKSPEWLNDVTLYHNRGNSLFTGENSLHGDFAGLDDVFTENPRVVNGFIDVYSGWIKRFGIDGFRIDTVKHVNLEFWEAFGPAIRAKALEYGHSDFFQFGEVADHVGDVAFMSEFSTTGNLDGTLDFGFYDGARDFVSKGHDAGDLARLFDKDAWYTGPWSGAQDETTFISNHDDGRFGNFLKQDNAGAGEATMADLFLLGQELLLTVRGQPALYYGDEQGMVGIGNDMGAREDMFASRAPVFRDLSLMGTTRKGGDDKFDDHHPFYLRIRGLAALRESSPALSRGAMILRRSNDQHVFAFSRIERTERVEYLVALNNSRTSTIGVTLPTSQAAGAALDTVFDSSGKTAARVLANADGGVSLSLAPLGCVILKAAAPLSTPASRPSIRFPTLRAGATFVFNSRSVYGHVLPNRQEIRADVAGGDGCAEVTFVLRRKSRPGESELLGTSDSPPYRVFWRPPADLAPGERISFEATVDDLRGHIASTEVTDLDVAPTSIDFGIRGATVPTLVNQPEASIAAQPGQDLRLSASASGTSPLDYRWIHDGREVEGATGPDLVIHQVSGGDLGHYRVLVHNREGTTLGREVRVSFGR